MPEYDDIPEGFEVVSDPTAPDPPQYSDVPEGFEVVTEEPQATQTPVMNVADTLYGAQEQMMPGMSAIPRAAEGFARGLQKAKVGAQQLFNEVDIWADEEERAEKRFKLKSELAALDLRTGHLGIPGEIGSLAGEVAPSMAVPGGPTGGLLKRVAGGVAADTIASVADPVREGETRAGNLQTAATFSGAFRGVGGGLSSAVQRLSNARAGNMADKEVQELLDAADANDVRLFFQDVSDGAIATKGDIAARSVFGRGSRAKQNKEAYDAASDWLAKVSGDGDDYTELVQSGLKNKLDIFKAKASRLYANVSNQIGEGAGEVATPRFNDAANEAIAAEAAKGSRSNPSVISFIERYRDAPRGTFDEMIEFRSDMRKDLDNLVKNEGMNYSSETSIRNAYNEIDKDMEAFAKSHGADELWRKANAFYADNVVDFKKGKLRALLKDDATGNFDRQAAWNYLSASKNNPQRARLMWQSLDAKGRNAVRIGLLTEALEQSTPTSGPFSPAKYASYLEKRMPVIEQFFRGERGEEIKGFIKVMRAAQTSADVLSQPTGVQAIPYLLGFGTAMAPTTGAAAITGLGGLKLLFETKTGRNLLLAANTATPGSKEFDNAMQAIETLLSRSSN